MDSIQLNSLDHYFADFITRLEETSREGLWIAAALVSAACCRGDVCIELSAMQGCTIVPFVPGREEMNVPPPGRWQELLSCCGTVGRPGEFTPLVLENAGRLYLHKFWNFERRAAEGILGRSGRWAGGKKIDEALFDHYFPPVDGEEDLQREAAKAVLTRRFTVISGGPGTGKTSTVARILALVAESAGDPVPRILLAAPTGKAAMRLKQSIAQSMKGLPLTDFQRSLIPEDVTTIHRLLGVRTGKTEFHHTKANPLECDLIVVDEASMIDLPLMARLLEALPEDARVVLLGDRDQLASVEAGAVMADICAGVGNVRPDAERVPAVVQLTKSYRFGDQSGIGRLSRLVHAGDGAGCLELLVSGQFNDVRWRSLPPEAGFAQAFKRAVSDGFGGLMRVTTPDEALVELERFRVLTPLRDGRYGVAALNRHAESVILSPGQGTFKAVMVTGNNYELGLYNGDTGVVSGTGPGPVACFTDIDKGLRRFSLQRLPTHETAFAMTVHKSQGSEFDTVLLILPEQYSPVLCRELLYTAITRAKKRLEIWGVEDVFCRTVERCVPRRSGLADRLWGERVS